MVAKPDGDREAAAAASPPATAARAQPTVTLLLEQHVETVYRYALRLAGRTDVAEDLAQETLLRGVRNIGKLREARATRVWLLRIATNLWTDHLRKARFEPRLLETEPRCPRRLPGQASDDRENVRLALAAMDELPPRQRQVLYLVTCEELSHAEVAEILGIGVAAVKANLSLARKEMRRRLKDLYEDVCARPTCKANDRDQ
jgi:RNA polymerase sigma-70 factor (ECF subfamily)